MTATKQLARPNDRSSRLAVAPDPASPDQWRTEAQVVGVGGDLEHLDGSQPAPEAHHAVAPVKHPFPDHHWSEAQTTRVGGDLQLGGSHAASETHTGCAPVKTPSPDHRAIEAQSMSVGGDLALPATMQPAKSRAIPSPADLPPDQPIRETQSVTVGGEHVCGHDASENQGGTAADVFLKLAAESLNDIEGARIATSHRIAAWDRPSDKGGLDLATDIPEYTRLVAIHDALEAAEKLAVREVETQMRRHPLGPWVKATTGVGLKQGARLIAAIGDPYWNGAEDRARRGPAELWAYCGYHLLPRDQTPADTHNGVVSGGNVIARRRKGQRANWSAEAKMRAHLVADNVVKAGVRKRDACDDSAGYDVEHRIAITPLGKVYLDARAKYAEAVHDAPCNQCGPAGKPATAGSPLSDGHKHARGLRAVAKAVLKDLYLDAKTRA